MSSTTIVLERAIRGIPGGRTLLIVYLVLGGLSATPVPGQDVVFSEVLFDPVGVNTGSQSVELYNPTDGELPLANHWLYFPPAQWQFPASASVPPRGTVVVHVNVPGTAKPGEEYFTGTSGMRNLRSSDAVSLFRSNLFTNPTQIVDFVQWGSFGNDGEGVATQAGIWFSFEFVNTASLREGSSIVYDGGGDSASDWCVDGTPSLGLPNDACTPSFAKSPVILSEIGTVRDGPGQWHPAVELANVGDGLEDIGGKWVVIEGGVSYQFPQGDPNTVVGPGESVVLHVGVADVDTPSNFYTGENDFTEFDSRGSVSFHAMTPTSAPANLLDFVQWGSAGSPLEGVAAAAGRWIPGEAVAIDDLRPRGSIASSSVGSGIARWHVDNTPTLGADNAAPPESWLVVNEVLLDPLGSDAGRRELELKNLRTGEISDPGGVTLCVSAGGLTADLACFTIPDGVSFGPGGYLVVRLNRSGTDGGGIVYTGPFLELDAAGGVLLVYLTPRVDDVNNLVDYVRWGDGPLLWEAIADSLHLWPGDAAVSVEDVSDGSSIAYVGEGDGAEFFRIDKSPSLGEDNEEPSRDEPFRRGDCNDDGDVDISDAIKLFSFLFLGERPSLCEDACDGNDDGSQDISDPIFILNYLFRGGKEPPAPRAGVACGLDPVADALTCDSFASCVE